MRFDLETTKKIANSIAEQLGYDIYQVEMLKEGGNRILRISIDHPNGIQHEDCERFSRMIDPALDEADPIPFSYFLEVSSPGIFRELRTEQDYHRFLGEFVKVICSQAVDQSKTHRGSLIQVTAEHFVLQLPNKELVIPRSLVKKIHLDIL